MPPDVVQGYVCAMYGAWKLMTAPDNDEVFRKAAAFADANPDLAVKAAKAWPIWAPSDEVSQQGLREPGGVANGAVAQAYHRTGQWLQRQGRLDTPPTMDVIVAYIDTSYAQKALGDGCR